MVFSEEFSYDTATPEIYTILSCFTHIDIVHAGIDSNTECLSTGTRSHSMAVDSSAYAEEDVIASIHHESRNKTRNNAAAEKLGGALESPVALAWENENHLLSPIRKTETTLPQYPRKNGIPAKRPLKKDK